MFLTVSFVLSGVRAGVRAGAGADYFVPAAGADYFVPAAGADYFLFLSRSRLKSKNRNITSYDTGSCVICNLAIPRGKNLAGMGTIQKRQCGEPCSEVKHHPARR